MILIVTQIIFFGLIEDKRAWLLVLDKMCLNNHIFNCNKRQMLKFVSLQIFKIYLHMIVQYIMMYFSEGELLCCSSGTIKFSFLFF